MQQGGMLSLDHHRNATLSSAGSCARLSPTFLHDLSWSSFISGNLWQHHRLLKAATRLARWASTYSVAFRSIWQAPWHMTGLSKFWFQQPLESIVTSAFFFDQKPERNFFGEQCYCSCTNPVNKDVEQINVPQYVALETVKYIFAGWNWCECRQMFGMGAPPVWMSHRMMITIDWIQNLTR